MWIVHGILCLSVVLWNVYRVSLSRQNRGGGGGGGEKIKMIGTIALSTLAVSMGSLIYRGKWVRINGPAVGQKENLTGDTWWINSAEKNSNSVGCTTSWTLGEDSGRHAPCPYPAATILNATFTSLSASLLIPFLIWFIHVGIRPRKHDLKRLLSYAALLIWRALVLYYFLGEIVESTFDVAKRPPTCWYQHLRRKNACASNFDFADHVVLYVVNYLLVLESERFAHRSTKATDKDVWREILTTLFQLACVYSQLVTASYYHSPEESFVGLLVATFGGVLPFLLLSNALPLPRLSRMRQWNAFESKKNKPV